MKDSNSNILFIVPPYLSIDEMISDEPESWVTSCAVPLGVLSIASYIEKYANAHIELLDLNVSIVNRSEKFMAMDWHKFLESEIENVRSRITPDIVGISAIFNSQIGYLSLISDYCKHLWPDVLVTSGGGGPSNLPKEVFNLAANIDAIAFGEGEKPFLDLVLSDQRKRTLETSKTWITRKGMQEGTVYKVDFVEDLDDIPYYKYELLETNYDSNLDGDENISTTQAFHNRNLSYVREGVIAASMMSSRGCPFHCTFCGSHTIHGRSMRYHSVERIVEDALKLREQFGVNAILFEDDLFFANRKKSIEFIDALTEEGFELDFSGGLSVIHLNHDNVISSLKRANVKVVKLAVESGSERVLRDLIKKPYNKLSIVNDVVKRLRDNDIYIRAFWVIGNPGKTLEEGETLEEIYNSFEFFKNSGCNWISIMIAAPISGSELYDMCKAQDLLINDEIDKFHFGKANIKFDHSTPEEFEQVRYLLNLDLNFVNNYDLKNHHPEKAMMGLEDVLSRVPTHAFANYYISECYRQMGDDDNSKKHLDNYFQIIKSNKKWYNYSKHFKLPLSPSAVNGDYHGAGSAAHQVAGYHHADRPVFRSQTND